MGMAVLVEIRYTPQESWFDVKMEEVVFRWIKVKLSWHQLSIIP
jgi:hypothetical protein